MVKYRPISPSVAWRNSQSSALSTEGRFLEIYLLTSPFANSIGCYEIVAGIACAEHGLSVDAFQEAVAELEAANLLERFGDYYLVKSWFRHHIWRSTLQGKCAVAAGESFLRLPGALKERWFKNCLDAGVPLSVLEEVCSPLWSTNKEVALGDMHNNTTSLTKLETTELITTTSTKLVIAPTSPRI